MIFYFLGFLISAGFSLYLMVRAFNEWLIQVELENYGTMEVVRLSECRRIAYKPASYRYFVTFRFDINGQQLQIKQTVSYRNFLKLYPGAFVTIAYLPYNPIRARLAKEHFDTTQRNIFTLQAIFFSPIPIFLFFITVG
jgi:hypothetical protein